MSHETFEGLHIAGVIINVELLIVMALFSFSFTVKSLVEETQYLLTLPGVHGSISSENARKILENYFGQLYMPEGEDVKIQMGNKHGHLGYISPSPWNQSHQKKTETITTCDVIDNLYFP